MDLNNDAVRRMMRDLCSKLEPYLVGRGHCQLSEDGNILVLVPYEDGHAWILTEFDGTFAILLFGCLVTTISLTVDDDLTNLCDSILAVIDGKLIEYVDTTTDPYSPAGYELHCSWGSMAAGNGKGRNVIPIKYLGWPAASIK